VVLGTSPVSPLGIYGKEQIFTNIKILAFSQFTKSIQ